MHISNFRHGGVTYEFEPPIDVGQHRVDSLSRLVTIAFGGSDLPASVIKMAEKHSEVAISYCDDNGLDVLPALSKMLEGKHTVRVK